MSNLPETAANNGYLRNHNLRVYPHGFFKVDAHWTVACWNREAEKLLLVPAISIVGENLWKKFSAVIPLDFYTLYHKVSIKSIPVHIQLNWAEMGGRFDVVTFYFNDTLSVYFSFRYAC
jgi:hypothetical protein